MKNANKGQTILQYVSEHFLSGCVTCLKRLLTIEKSPKVEHLIERITSQTYVIHLSTNFTSKVSDQVQGYCVVLFLGFDVLPIITWTLMAGIV